jgi:hypothetical protein
MLSDRLFKIHCSIVMCSPVVGVMFNPDYNKRYSFRRNCFNGMSMGLWIGMGWPVTIPLLSYCYVKKLVESDPVSPEEWSGKYEEYYKDEKEK